MNVEAADQNADFMIASKGVPSIADSEAEIARNSCALTMFKST